MVNKFRQSDFKFYSWIHAIHRNVKFNARPKASILFDNKLSLGQDWKEPENKCIGEVLPVILRENDSHSIAMGHCCK